MLATALSLLVLTTIGLLFGAVWLWRRGGSRRRIALMLVLAAIMAANVAMWTVPTPGGAVPLEAATRAG